MSRIRPAALALAASASLALAAPASAIVGGEPTDRSWPWMAGMEHRDGSGGEWSFRCGGSLVAPDVVLTAAHCVDADDGGTEPAANFRFLIGTNKRSTGGERIQATQVAEHPNYDEDEAGGHDVALLKLERSTSLGAPIALAGPGDAPLWEPGDPATVIGWGTEFFGSPFLPDHLMEATVPVRSDADCAATSVFTIDPETMVCAGNVEGGEDSCQGDSGGPLMVPSGTTWKQIGVVSFGLGCAFPTQYGVYAEVGDDPLRSWVQERSAAMSSASQDDGTTDSGGTADSGGTTDSGGAKTDASDPAPAPSPGPAAGSGSNASLPVVVELTPARFKLPATIGSLRRARGRGAFMLRVRFSTPVTVRASLRRRGRLLARGSRRGVRRGTVRMRLTRRARRIRPGRAVLRLVIVDGGRRSTVARRVTIKR